MTTEQISEKKPDKRAKPIVPGTQFGLLTALRYVGPPKCRWLCRCDCGYANCRKEIIVQASKLRLGHTGSCGHKKSCDGAGFIRRIKKRVIVNENGCWLWPTGKGDYGRILVRGKMVRIHRRLWEVVNGPISDGLEVCHNCPGGIDNRACCNLDHLYLGTHQDNATDTIIKDQVCFGEEHYFSKLTDSKALDIFTKFHAESATIPDLAIEHAVDKKTIRSVVQRESWRRATEKAFQKLEKEKLCVSVS